MKKYLAIILVVAMVLGLAACSSSKAPAQPSDDVYKKDAQEYITEVLNSDAQISSFKTTNSEQKDDTLKVTCDVTFGESRGEFSLTYTSNGKEWTLEKCRVQLADPDSSQDQTEPTTDNQTDPTTDNQTEPSDPIDQTEPTKPVTPVDRGYQLSEVGTIQDTDRNMIIDEDMVFQVNGQFATLLNYLGQSKNDLQLNNGEYLGNGVYAVQNTSDDINSIGLVAQDGTVLIPCEACKIAWPADYSSKTDRYLIVTYATGQTTNVDDCFIYETDSIISWGPEEGDTMYTGYARVYDLKNRRFVDNVKITNSDSYAMKPCGDNFFVEDEKGISILYNENGENIFQTARTVEVADAIFTVYDSGTYRVYDSNGKQTYTSNKGVYIIEGNGGYIYKYENDRSVIMDRYGNQVCGTVVEYVYSELDGIFRVKNNGKYGLLHVDGTVVAPCDKYEAIYYVGCGIYEANYSNGSDYTNVLIDKNGVIKDGVPGSGTSTLSFMEDGKAFVLNRGTYSLQLEDDYPSVLDLALIASGSDTNGLYGVFDLFTGTQLLPYEYEVIEAAAGYLYAYKNGAWKVFQIIGPVG